MDKCSICKESIISEGDYVNCSLCKEKLHYNCANVREESWRKLSAKNRAIWRCYQCKTNPCNSENDEKEADVPVHKVKESVNPIMLALITSAVKAAIKEENKSLHDKIDNYQQSLDFFSFKFEEFTISLNNLEQENKKLKVDCKETAEKCKSLERENQLLNIKIEEDRQYARNHNVQIDGIPEKAGEDMVNTAIALASSLEIDLKKGDIQAVHRIKSKNPSKKPIIMQFSNRLLCDEFLNKAKSRKPTTAFCGMAAPQPIYVNEHMTPYYRNLFFEAKNKKVNNGSKQVFKFVWFKNSKLFVRKEDSSPKVRVLSAADLEY
ncbi:hypothetical protein RI129_011961 [Pyrocoelia pectoralis]|uniref:PHD-type domain-containing protein n=1 Tax=Pyrocoelia pectoralis TaxID=417401 RepID=A0AAN7V9T5_9COLE